MAEITNTESGNNRSLNKKPRSKKQALRVDMTPMVDLGFLLIAFFMLTSVMDHPKRLLLDKRIEGDPSDVGECQVLSVLIDSFDQVYTYEGMDTKAMKRTSFDAEHGVRQVILNKGKRVKNECGKQLNGKQREMICLIKLLPGAHYQSMVSIFDEMEITGTKVYSMQEPLAEEIKEVGQQELLAEK